MKVRTRRERVVNANHGMVVTPDLYYMRNPGRKNGVRSISMMSAMFGTALDVKPWCIRIAAKPPPRPRCAASSRPRRRYAIPWRSTCAKEA